ncbi:capsular polysaccharide biosynthesis protein [Bacteroidia bacterium]|nr:capsular polysaccharide biosynthesis protein [Bacteroidia bacterium]
MEKIKKMLISVLRSTDYKASLEKAALYYSINDKDKIHQYQVHHFNQIWQEACNDIPFYEQWKKRHSLPDKINSLDELSHFPVLTKKEIQEHPNLFIRKSKQPDYYLMTGGSTGQPLKFGCVHGQSEVAVNKWIGRVRYGIYPGSRTFLLWGHHHLYGKGIKSYFNQLLRKSKDWIMNSYRVSAYDLSTKKMREAAKKMIAFRPEAIIGYSAAVLSFCRTNRINQKSMANSGIKCVICSAGPLSKEEQQEISTFFNAPLCMEYGSVECGVMAYTNPETSEYDIFWNTHLIETQKDNFGYKNIVTQLTSPYFTLIRYDVGDYLKLSGNSDVYPLSVETILGRPSDIVTLPDGTSFWGNLIGDSVKQVNTVISSQLFVDNDSLEIHLISSKPLSSNDINLIKNRCYTVVPALKNIKLAIVEKQDLYKTPAGKIPLIVYSNRI